MTDVDHLQGGDDLKVSIGGRAWIYAETGRVKKKGTGFWRRKTVVGSCP